MGDCPDAGLAKAADNVSHCHPAYPLSRMIYFNCNCVGLFVG